MSGRWLPKPVPQFYPPGKGKRGRISKDPHRQDKNNPRWLGWLAGQDPAPFGGTFAVHHRLSAGVGAPPQLSPLHSQSTPWLSPWFMLPLHLGHRWSRQGSSFQWPLALLSTRSIPPPLGRSTVRLPKYSWSSQGIIPTEVP